MYVDYEYYLSLYGDMEELDFNRYSWDACKKLDHHTTGVDGVKKLKDYFPVDEDDAEAVKRCVCKLIETMCQISTIEKSMGFSAREDGTVQGKLVSSVSAGNESISFSSGQNQIISAVSDAKSKQSLFRDIITEHLSGVKDANGINLLYMGPYPKGAIK